MKHKFLLVIALTVSLIGCNRQKSETIDTSMMQAPAAPPSDEVPPPTAGSDAPMAAPSPTAPESAQPIAPAQPPQQQRIHYQLPPGWTQQPGADMRYATLEGPDGVEIAITVFGGDVGGELANINRWRKQMGLKDITESEIDQNVTRVSNGNNSAVLVDISNNNQRMLAAMLPDDNQTWFFKMMGPKETITKHVDEYMQILKSVTFGANAI